MSPEQEKQLISAAQQGDQAALGQLLEKYQHRLYSVALRMLNNRDDAAEITQDAMVKVVMNISKYNGQAALTTWMIRIVMNLSISYLRKRRLRHTTSLDAPMGSNNGSGNPSALGDALPAPGELQPDSSVQNREMLEKLHQCLHSLEDDFRAVIILRDLNEMDYQAISEVLDIPVGTVKSRLFRARLALRQAMKHLVDPQSADSAANSARNSAKSSGIRWSGGLADA
jgi:RNA polymerase sigma-70 factor (ECF subfamily)